MQLESMCERASRNMSRTFVYTSICRIRPHLDQDWLRHCARKEAYNALAYTTLRARLP